MKKHVQNNSTKALIIKGNTNLTVVKKIATKSMIISSKALFAAFVLTFVNLFV